MDLAISRKRQVLGQARDLLNQVEQDLKNESTAHFISDDVQMKTYNSLITEAVQLFPEDPVLNGQLVIMPDAALQSFSTLLPITSMPPKLPSQRLKQHQTLLKNRLELVLGETVVPASITVNPAFYNKRYDPIK